LGLVSVLVSVGLGDGVGGSPQQASQAVGDVLAVVGVRRDLDRRALVRVVHGGDERLDQTLLRRGLAPGVVEVRPRVGLPRGGSACGGAGREQGERHYGAESSEHARSLPSLVPEMRPGHQGGSTSQAGGAFPGAQRHDGKPAISLLCGHTVRYKVFLPAS